MGLKVDIIASGSSGNCGLIETSGSRFLVDVGISARRIVDALKSRGMALEEIDGIFLTHEHGDHSVGLKGILRRRDLPVYASRGTAKALARKLVSPARWRLFSCGQRFRAGDCLVSVTSIPHDAAEPMAFLFSTGEDTLFEREQSVLWMLDLGSIPPSVIPLAEQAAILVVEANHDEQLLSLDTQRPWATKNRIRGPQGHLSNAAIGEFLRDIKAPRLEKIILAHLSCDCNATDRMTKTFGGLLPQSMLDKIHFVEPQSGRLINLFNPSEDCRSSA